ncbi:MAG: hypothetical protein D6701_07365 [Gemmatimonadetes bacterium]|nr:MAG: hypothetical protein D6701_07365 [Gemmatimonadota bacterium]
MDSVTTAREALFTGPACQGICGRSGVPGLRARRQLGTLQGGVGQPTANERILMAQARAAASDLVTRVNELYDRLVRPYSDALAASGFTPFPPVEPLEVGGGPGVP